MADSYNDAHDDASNDDHHAHIAIVGMALRVPGAQQLDQFWANLRDGVESTTFFTDDQLRAAGVADQDLSHPDYVKAFGSLAGVELFDAGFFDIPPREAEILDPQHRHLLECSWEALEHAGYDPGSPFAKDGQKLRIGLFGGIGLNSYLLHHLLGRQDLIDTLGGWQIILGNDKDFSATRVAYKLDLRGPAISVSTACSTSLVSVAMGCQSLLSWQCDMVVAGGCSIHLPKDQGYWYHAGGTLSPDGRCRAFDVNAQGTLDGNGVAMVVLKRLDDALADGDTIHAVIRGFAVNNDGELKVGYTAPSVEGQAAAIREAQEMAEVDAATIGYVETHGTGTDLGDLVEVSALIEAFRDVKKTSGSAFCGLGSVKTNFGHLDTAAGTASLIKTVLSLQHRQIPPSLHFTRPNPKLQLEHSPFYVNAALRDWPRLHGAPRRAGVSSFGIGGTNAHVVVEEAPQATGSDAGRPWQIVPLAARSPAALDQAAAHLARHLQGGNFQSGNSSLADVAYTLQLGRRGFAERKVVLARQAADAATALVGAPTDKVLRGHAPEHAPGVVFMFPGQDAQFPGMVQSLYRDEPLFRAEVDRCGEIVRKLFGIDLMARLTATADAPAADAPSYPIDPLPLFVVEYALAQVWLALGVKPRAMLGYSMGEYACACLAGVISLEDGLRLAVVGGRLLSVLKPGGMLAVTLAEAELRPLLLPGLDIAMISTPRQCVVAGPVSAVAQLQQTLAGRDVSFVRLPMALPFHTEFMEPFLAPYRQELAKVRFSPPKIPYISCITGDWVTAEQATNPDHYLGLSRHTVRLAQGFKSLWTVNDAVLLEVGPGQTLSSLALLQPGRPAELPVLSTLREARFSSQPETDQAALANAVGRLWVAGVDIQWSAFYQSERRRRVPLPTYPFERQRYWVEPNPAAQTAIAQPTAAADAPVVKLADRADWFYAPVWRELPPLAATDLSGRWLVVGAPHGVAPLLVNYLKQHGADAVLAHLGAHSGISGDDYLVDISHAAGWDGLFDAMGARPDHIVHCALLDLPDDAGDQAMLNAGFASLVALGQSLGRRLFSEAVNVSLVTDGVFPVGDAPLKPAKAAAIGPLKVLPQEYPNIRCRSLDISLPAADWQRQRLVADLARELVGPERAVALRQGRRWVEAFERLPLPAVDAPKFREGGVYLITGGLGNVGLTLAGAIARRVAGPRIVLTGRKPLPPRDTWAGIAGDSALGQRVQGVLALEAAGAVVEVAAVDVTDAAAMTALVAGVEKRFGALTGVVHAAGLVGQESFATFGESTTQFCAAQMAPKLNGTRVLEQVLGARPLDFCLHCSSLSPILGGLGFAAYAAANTCQDALVLEHNQRHPTRWLCVNWEGWRFGEEPKGKQAGAALAELGLTPSEGSDAFERMVTADATRVVISTGDLALRIRQWVDIEGPKAEEVAVADTLVRHARPALMGGYVAPQGPIEQELAQLWERLLGIDGIGAQDSFFELGGNSLLLIQLLAQIRKAFRLELSLANLFERPTIAEVAALINEASGAGEDREEGLL